MQILRLFRPSSKNERCPKVAVEKQMNEERSREHN